MFGSQPGKGRATLLRRLGDHPERTARRHHSVSDSLRPKLADKRRRLIVAVVSVLSLTGIIAATVPAGAALPPIPAASSQFDITGFAQSTTLDPVCVAAAGTNLDAQGHAQVAHCGGTVTINGHVIVVPAEVIVILPASALTWQELFTHAPAPYAPTQTGMALADVPTPHTTYEFSIAGNHVIVNGQNRYIAGLVHVSQQDLNGGSGHINFINYTDGSMEVGGVIGVQGTGAVVRINDPAATDPGTGLAILDANGVPTGRFGRAFSPDSRFQVDQDNPTIVAETGFPMCVPRVTADPSIPGNTDDPLCPVGNRPLSNGLKDAVTGQTHPPAGQFDTIFTMNPTGIFGPAPESAPCSTCRSTQQAPFEVGDFVSYAGTLTQGAVAGTPDFILAHTIVASLGISTQAGTNPAYVTVEVSLIGTGGLTVFGAGEAAIRTKFEGFSTDPSRNVHVYGIDINPVTGATTDRDYGSVGVDQGPPLLGAVKGRWRLRPPCKLPALVPGGPLLPIGSKDCTLPPGGSYLSPTREVRAVVEGLQQFQLGTSIANPASQIPGTPTAVTTANGIYYGQYHAPVGEYIFPENVPGTPVPEDNFNSLDFLAYGGYQSITGVQAGVLNPWPSSVAPPALVAATPTLIGNPYSVANGGTINLSGSVNADATSPVKLSWTAGTTAGGTDLNGALTNATTTTPTFNATGLAAGTYFLTFSATNVTGTLSAATLITVQPAPAPTINPIAAQTVQAGSTVTINASSASLPAPTWTWTGLPVGFTQTPSAATPFGTSTVQFTAPAVAGVYTYQVTATNINGTSQVTNVTITVTTGTITNFTITSLYRISKQRAIFTAVGVPLDVTAVTLQPYRLENGTMFNPASLGAASFTNAGGGLWNLTVVGSPPPACRLGGAYTTPPACTTATFIATSTGGAVLGTSAPTVLQQIRQ